ncbi:MAG: response regulator [Caulobacteraceae bacterium]
MSDSLQSGERTAAPAAPMARLHVLILDEHSPSRRICADYCDLFGHSSVGVVNGEEALAALKRERFDAVVMNVRLASARDFETLRAIRALPDRPSHAPVVGLLASDRGDEARRWLAAGMAAVAPKPITAARLFAALAAAAEPPATQPDEARSWAPRR